jgi:signal transduction histidine kinase
MQSAGIWKPWRTVLPLQIKIFVFVAVLLLLIAFEWVFFSVFESRVLQEEMSDRGSVLVRTLAQLSAEPVLAFQITRLEQLLDSMLEEKDVVHARVYNSNYTVLAATDREQEGWTYSGQIVDSMQIRHDPELMVAKAPIIVMEQTLGMAEIVFSLSTLKGKVSRSRMIFLTIFISELLLAVAFAVFLEIQVIRPLGKLAGEVQEIRPDSLQMPLSLTPFSAKEISRLRHSLDDMREKLRRAQADIVARTRLATMGQIAANITHEIRNPLEAMSGAVEILSSEPNLNADSRESVAILREEIRNLDDYLNQYLEFARPMPVKPVSTNINVLVEDCLVLLRPLLRKKHVQLHTELANGLPSCRLDVNQLKRVIVNIVLNSIEAISDHGTLQVSTTSRTGRVQIAVRDDGEGVREEDLPRVFDPYFTTKSSGSGLGLPLSKMIIEQHEGTILIESRLGEGSVVTVSLPAEPEGVLDG